MTVTKRPFENIEGKGENAGNQHFLLFAFPTMFPTHPITNLYFSITFNLSSANAFNLDQSKILLFGTELTLFQMGNFRLFETERLCRQQFQILMKWQKVQRKGRKHCGKRRNSLLRAISPFPTVFSKNFYCRHVKTRACLGKGLILSGLEPLCLLTYFQGSLSEQ